MSYSQALFLGHGSPTNAIEQNAYSQFLASYAQKIPQPDAIVVISAHWVTRGTFVTADILPRQIYDFYGFQDELYRIRYEPPGKPELAERLAAEIEEITADGTWGLDHGAWSLLVHMFPEQNIPVLQLSLDLHKSPEAHFQLAEKLANYRKENILFLGSGNLVHNLRRFTFEEGVVPFPWAVDIDNWLKEKLESQDMEAILNYKKTLPDYEKAVPTPEHFLPLLYILGMKQPDEKIQTIYEEIQHGSISMRGIEVS